MKRLTSGTQDLFPAVTPDGKWVVYSSVQGDQSVLMKVPSHGGPATRLTDYNADVPAISPDGKWIACFRGSQGGHPSSLAIIPSEGGPPAKTFPLPPTALVSALEWAPDGRAVGFIDEVNGVGNIWQQPIAGGSAQPVTHFTSGKIFKFRWSRDGRLALSGGTETMDAILIRNFRERVR
jgi:Tol biopolymer transport system component